MSTDRELDVVLFGATSFVGRLCAEYLVRAAPAEARIGLGGRSRERLLDLQKSLGSRAADWPLLVADTNDARSVNELAATTRALASTVGPYRRYGLPVVEACATAGTHYADLTGEVLFMRDAIDRFDDTAAASGARIVHSCGFDSIPSDLGVLVLHEAVTADGAGQLEDTTLVVRAMKGGASGGTIASLKGTVDDARSDRELARTVADPYALSPDRDAEPDLGPEPDLRGIQNDRELGMWIGPFIMGSINTRAVLDRVLPSPGEGPSERQRNGGFFRIEIHARTSSGARYLCRVAAQGDPGYKATAVMFGESALCLALDGERLPPRAGVLTPATAMGDALIDRLRRAGQTLEVERIS